MTDKKELKKIIKKKSIVFGADHPIVSTNGERNTTRSSWLVDLRATVMDSKALGIIANCFWKKYSDTWPFQVGGLEAGAIPIISAILLKGQQLGKPINGFFVRKERKKTGLCQLIEGKIDKRPIVIVDDLINSGLSLKQVLVAVKNESKLHYAKSVFVIVDFENEETYRFLQEENIKLEFIFKLQEFGLKIKSKKIEKRNSGLSGGQKIVWRCRFPIPNYYFVVPKSSPAADNDMVYIGSDSGIFWAIDQIAGKVAWSFKTGKHKQQKGIFSSPVIHGKNVFFGSYDGNVYCLDKKSGKLVWSFSEADWIGSSPVIGKNIGALFIGLEHSLPGRGGSIAALDLKTGRKKWDFFVKEYLHGTPAYCDELGLVAIGTNDSELLLFGAKRGKLHWRFRARGPMKSAPVFSVKHQVVIVSSHDGNVYAVDIKTGKQSWSVETDNLIYSTPVIHRDKCFVTSSDKNLYVISLKNGRVFTKFTVYGKIPIIPQHHERFAIFRR